MKTNAVNIENRYINNYNAENELLIKRVVNMNMRMLGFGFRRKTDIVALDNFLLPNFLLVYMIKGTGNLKHNGETMHMLPESLYLLKPFELYDGIRTSKEPLEYLYVYFDMYPVEIRTRFKQYAFGSGDDLYMRPWVKKMIPLLKHIIRYGKDDLFLRDVMLQNILHSLVAFILFEQINLVKYNENAVHYAKENNIVNNVFDYTEKHLDEQLDIEAMSKRMGISRSSLNRAFMKTMQISPLKSLIRFKMNFAFEFLRKGMSVQETAKAIGYDSPFHFSRSFKQVMGKCPTEYIKM
jgi:AraC-like DNA-binding protein